MAGKKADSPSRAIKTSLNRRILRSTILNILIVVIVCCVIMALAMQSLANNILLDSLQPMVRQSAKTVEANIHMLADRMITIAGDPRMSSAPSPADTQANRQTVLTEAAEIYELYTIALYGLDGRLLQGTEGAPESLESGFFALLQETDNLRHLERRHQRHQPGQARHGLHGQPGGDRHRPPEPIPGSVREHAGPAQQRRSAGCRPRDHR